MEQSVYAYIAVMAVVTYLIRMLPLTLLRREIRSPFVRSFLHYVPYVTLSVMVFPGILSATGSLWSALIGFAAAVAAALLRQSLFRVAVYACLAVLLSEFVLL